jgi:hypothetical protein
MLKASIIGIIGFMIGAGTVAAIVWTKSEAAHQRVTPTASFGMPSIEELHAQARAQNLPDRTVKEPY